MSERWDSMKATSALLASGLMTMGWKFWKLAGVIQLVGQIVERDAQPFSDDREILHYERGVVAEQQDAEGGIVVYEHVAVAIEHRRPQRRDYRKWSECDCGRPNCEYLSESMTWSFQKPISNKPIMPTMT